MIKIKTMFKREIVDNVIVSISPEVVEGCEWVLNEPCIATRKMDGTAAAIIEGRLYARLDYKNLKSKILPEGAIACQPEPDLITGSHPYWVPVAKDGVNVLNALEFRTADVVTDMGYKHHYKAFKRLLEGVEVHNLTDLDGSYELCGNKVKNNPEQLDTTKLIKHGSIVLEGVGRTFESIKEYLENHYIEGIVFYRQNGDMAKIKRTDCGLEWRGDKRRVSTKEGYAKRRKKKKYYGRK